MEPARSADRVFFPLDEQLGLDGSDLTPHAQEHLVHLAMWMPFAYAARTLRDLSGVQVSKASARRCTLHAGQAALQEWEEQTRELQENLPAAPMGASKVVMSADGAMVPLVGGVWAEVKTLAIGEVGTSRTGEVQTQDLSYCSRLTDVEGFERATLLEVHRRGVEQAGEVAAVTDGAEWLPAFVAYHRADALHILDFAHAAEYVNEIGEAVRKAGFSLSETWLQGVLHRLKHDGPERVLDHLQALCQHCHDPQVDKKWQYLARHRQQMQYPTYRAAGWPIGSGMVESANKVVMEARLKGSGMHWQRQNVNPMLILRNAIYSLRWAEMWQGRIKQVQQGRKLHRQQQTHMRMEQASAQLLPLVLPFFLAASQVRAQQASAVMVSPPLTPCIPASPAPKGRTEAQKRWGRRPISARGFQLQAEFAKK